MNKQNYEVFFHKNYQDDMVLDVSLIYELQPHFDHKYIRIFFGRPTLNS